MNWRCRLLPSRLFELLDLPARVYLLCVQLSYKKRSSSCGLNGLNRSAISRLFYATEINALHGRDGLRVVH